ncbi:DUF418 domain-containing protein [Priestia taiwanensis]|uniref:DUF418 domain-containing protein n=1 Tax=Priestia taiwanensis TaxID=1347902 RepID=A0A917EMM2_9BACI|nr:DUF418 domain-containing protein [Priestia taiwanensis]MBM7361786.1 uncharacterized protein [Priestia taiwanensis]GGE56994.1 hypothetical protein GCM10007140_04130 [Priestia taiwanensis]
MENRVKRIRILDILRGFAILGTLGTNIWIFGYWGDTAQIFMGDSQWWTSADRIIQTICLVLVNGKFLGLLSVMFGIGLEMKYQQSLRKGNPWPGTYLWVSMILMLEGFIHFTLVMEYDILMGYAAAAIIVSFIVKRGDKAIWRTIKWLGGIYTVLVLTLSALLFSFIATGGDITGDGGTDIVALYQTGSWLDQVQYRLSNFVILRFEVIFALPLNIVLFLIGVMLMRKGAFGDNEVGRNIRVRLFKYGILIGLPLNLLLLVPGHLFDIPVRYLFAPLLAMGYVAIIARLVESRPDLRIWSWLEQTGKMSLSCYVVQNVLSSVIFYGWGMGLGNKLNSISIIGVWIGLSIIQILFAIIWLRLFRMGPMEEMRKRAVGLLAKGA